MSALHRPGETPVTRFATLAVRWFSVTYAIAEVGGIAVTTGASAGLVAAGAAAAFVPLHLHHLRFGLRGARVPNGALTLTIGALVQVLALVLIGPAWSFMLALLAVSALVVLPWPWSMVALAGCASAPAATSVLIADLSTVYNNTNAFNLGFLVVLFSVVQFALVWLVAAANQLEMSREAAARAAADSERLRVRGEVHVSLGRHLETIVTTVGALDLAGTAAAASDGLDRLLDHSRQALSEVRAIAAGDRAADQRAANPATYASGGARGPIARSLATPRAVRACVIVHILVLVHPLLLISGAFGPVRGYPLALLVPAWAGLTALQVVLSVSTARGRLPRQAGLAWLGIVVLAAGPLPFSGPLWGVTVWPLGAATAMVLSGRRRVAGVAVVVIASATYDVASYVKHVPDVPVHEIAWRSFSVVVLYCMVMVGLYASARLVAVVRDLTATWEQARASAVLTARHALSRDLHDVLGQCLTAITLKADLARQLLATEPDRAGREIRELAGIAESLSLEVDRVTGGRRDIALSTERDEASALLRAAGIEVHERVELAGVSDQAAVLLAWALREGATNVVRHSNASRCDISLRRDGGSVVLELLNDGADGGATRGSGLVGLDARFRVAQGTVSGKRLPGGRFRLRAEVPD